eukprot:jgi/Botrbrau1/6471/Bobra.0034s0045.1
MKYSARSGCASGIEALEQCQRKHGYNADVVCRSLNRTVAWCLVSQICPDEVLDVEGCVGTTKGQRGGPPSKIPPQCQGAMDRLDACMEGHVTRGR